MDTAAASSPLAHRVKRLAHLDLPGSGQVVVQGGHAFLGHMEAPHGTTIVDISDPRRPRVVAEIGLDLPDEHSHKVRVVGDIMYTNLERPSRRFAAKGVRFAGTRAGLEQALGRAPTRAELAEKLKVTESQLPQLEEWSRTGFPRGGIRVWDVSDIARPRQIAHLKTGGVGAHRFDVDERYAYISTGMEGYGGNILINYDVKDPARPQEVSRWWLPGQHIAGGETPEGPYEDWHLHHALRYGDLLWAGCFNAGLRVIDVSDIRKPRTVGAYNYHPPVPDPTHTVMRVPHPVGGRDVALAIDEAHGRRPGRMPAGLWLFDVGDLANIRPLGHFQMSELDTPWARKGGRFGAHQFQEHLSGTLVYCAWFSGGLRVVDIRDPFAPEEIAWYIPEPCGGATTPQTNDVEVDARGLVYIVDRNCGFDILEVGG
ncbi:MAG TPA: hypothetical protein VMN03_16675 [Burkholderiales bacterium]|nr:hypothetical protein [Burkholderiales bacterium]